MPVDSSSAQSRIHRVPQTTVAIAGGGWLGSAAPARWLNPAFAFLSLSAVLISAVVLLPIEHPGTGEIVDNCQHVLFRVCTNLLDFYRRMGVEDKIRWYEEMTFLEPGGRTSVMLAVSAPRAAAYCSGISEIFRFSKTNS